MCLIAFALSHDPACPLRLASNRDEFVDRATEPLHAWRLDNGVVVYGGRDGQERGTWLALSEHGRLAWLTNVREAQAPKAQRSRGALVTDWLASDLHWTDWPRRIAPGDFGGFNLVVGDLRQGQWAWLSNRDPACVHHDPAPRWHSHALGPGLYGLSNASLNTAWPKTQFLTNALRLHWPAQPQGGAWPPKVLEALADGQLGTELTEHDLPTTGLGSGHERILSNPFVHWPERRYGTRSSTLLAVAPADQGAGWRLHMSEWTHAWTDETPATGGFARAARRDLVVDLA